MLDVENVSAANSAEEKRESITATLEVDDVDKTFLVGLPMFFSTNQLPVFKDCIPKQKDAARSPYRNNARLHEKLMNKR